ncbi:hypothetical protein AB9F42_35750, partial [Rhizobium leguminosarum]|uniref:hypothetical protein n=1 Tax=Rhizobium leguminosarum TaxID=384 RepID=UPI003F94A0C1
IKPVRQDNRENIELKKVLPAIRATKYWLMIFMYLMIAFTSLTALSTVSVYYTKYILKDLSMMSWVSVSNPGKY